LKTDPQAIRIIEAAQAALPSLQRAQTAGGRDVVVEVLSLIAIDRPVKDKTKEHWAEHIRLYTETLGDFPADAIRAGAKDVIRDAEIYGFPNVAQLLAKVSPHAQKIRMAAYRAKVLAEAEAREKPSEVTDEDRAMMLAEIADLKRKLPRPPVPTASQIRAEYEAKHGIDNGAE
jgi:hypothetical protein